MHMVMIIPGLFRQRKPRRFTYRPLFYDQRAEAREERKKKYMAGTGREDALNYMPSLRKGSFRDHHRTTHKNVHNKSNIRLFVIILLLGLLTYILFIR